MIPTHPPSAPPRPHIRHALIAGLFTIGFGLAIVAALGPLMTGAVEYRVTETLRNQTIGLDAVSLLVVAPLALFAAGLIRRGHLAGAPIALGIGAYTAYMVVQYVVGPDYAHLPGDNERLFPLLLVLFVAGWSTLLGAWRVIDTERLPRPRRRDGVILAALALFAFIRYLPALVDAMSGAPRDQGYVAGPAFFWTIALLDLGVFLPLTAAACAGPRVGATWTGKALYCVSGWFGLVGPAVAGMAIAMQLGDDPAASTGSTLAMTILGLAFAGFAIAVFRPLFRARG